MDVRHGRRRRWLSAAGADLPGSVLLSLTKGKLACFQLVLEAEG